MIIEKHILIIWNVLFKSSSNSPSVQVLHQQIRGGVKTCTDLADSGGDPRFGKTCWCNTWTLPYPPPNHSDPDRAWYLGLHYFHATLKKILWTALQKNSKNSVYQKYLKTFYMTHYSILHCALVCFGLGCLIVYFCLFLFYFWFGFCFLNFCFCWFCLRLVLILIRFGLVHLIKFSSGENFYAWWWCWWALWYICHQILHVCTRFPDILW